MEGRARDEGVGGRAAKRVRFAVGPQPKIKKRPLLLSFAKME